MSRRWRPEPVSLSEGLGCELDNDICGRSAELNNIERRFPVDLAALAVEVNERGQVLRLRSVVGFNVEVEGASMQDLVAGLPNIELAYSGWIVEVFNHLPNTDEALVKPETVHPASVIRLDPKERRYADQQTRNFSLFLR